MRRHAIQIADALAAGSTAVRDLRFKQNKRHAYLDRVLLDVVTNEPNAIESAFAALFARNPPDRILRFLDGDSSRIEEAKIVASMPKGPFLRAARRVR
jgi:lycopene beta-cyclase